MRPARPMSGGCPPEMSRTRISVWAMSSSGYQCGRRNSISATTSGNASTASSAAKSECSDAAGPAIGEVSGRRGRPVGPRCRDLRSRRPAGRLRVRDPRTRKYTAAPVAGTVHGSGFKRPHQTRVGRATGGANASPRPGRVAAPRCGGRGTTRTTRSPSTRSSAAAPTPTRRAPSCTSKYSDSL